MPDTIRTKLRTSVEYGLAQITTAHGYNLDMGDVNRNPIDFGRAVNHPACNVLFGTEQYLNIEDGGHVFGVLHKRLPVEMDFYCRDVNDLDQTRNKIQADVEKYFLTYPWLPNSTDPYTAITLMFTGSEPWGFEGTLDRGGITVSMDVIYQQNILDPTSMTPSTTVPSVTSDFPTSISISMRELIRNAIITNIKSMTTTSYNFNWKSHTAVVSPSAMMEFPYCNVTAGGDTVDNRDTDQDDLLKKHMDFTLEAYSSNVNDPTEEREKMLGDLEKLFMNKFYIPDSDGKRTCFNCMFIDNTPFGIEDTNPNCGIDVGLRVWYHHNMTDPTDY